MTPRPGAAPAAIAGAGYPFDSGSSCRVGARTTARHGDRPGPALLGEAEAVGRAGLSPMIPRPRAERSAPDKRARRST
jgi:hypothetical protein